MRHLKLLHLHYLSLVAEFTISLWKLVRDINTMVTEDQNMPAGWPLGLAFMNARFRVAETVPPAPVEPYSLLLPSTSFSSFSSSNLDTESSASFFQDNSMSLGHLIGMKPRDRGRLYFQSSTRFEERSTKSAKHSGSNTSTEQRADVSQGICIPVLVCAMVKISRNRKKSVTVRCWDAADDASRSPKSCMS